MYYYFAGKNQNFQNTMTNIILVAGQNNGILK
jgi:hypothetical protein